MDREGIEYQEVDLRENPDKVQEFKELGHLSAPIVTAGEQIWSGFKLERINGLKHGTSHK
jgi:glutaredoxin